MPDATDYQEGPVLITLLVSEHHRLLDIEARAKTQLELCAARDDAEVSASYETADFILNGENCVPHNDSTEQKFEDVRSVRAVRCGNVSPTGEYICGKESGHPDNHEFHLICECSRFHLRLWTQAP